MLESNENRYVIALKFPPQLSEANLPNFLVKPYEHLLEITKSSCILKEIREKRFRWLGHFLRMKVSNITRISPR